MNTFDFLRFSLNLLERGASSVDFARINQTTNHLLCYITDTHVLLYFKLTFLIVRIIQRFSNEHKNLHFLTHNQYWRDIFFLSEANFKTKPSPVNLFAIVLAVTVQFISCFRQ